MSSKAQRRAKAAASQAPVSPSQSLTQGTPVENTNQEGQAAEKELPPVVAAGEAQEPVVAAAEGESAEVQEGSVEEPSMPAVNINSDMPQESDPIESGEMKEVIDAMVDPVPEINGDVVEGLVATVIETTTTAAPAADVVAAEPTPEIQPVGAPIVGDVGEEPKSEEQLYLDGLLLNGSEAQKRLLAAVDTFATRLRPKAPITPEDCNRAQVEFLRHLQWILKKDYEIFRGAWNALLVYFSVNHGISTPNDYSALSEYSATRYMNSWPKTQEECVLFVNLISVLRSTRNRNTRKHNIKLIDLNKVGPGILGEKEISNLKQFYEA